MKIIAVYGVNDSGKSAAVRRFVDTYLCRSEFSDIQHALLGDEDLICTAKYGIKNNQKIKVGIVSQGDNETNLRSAFEQFTDCDVVICASRTKGGSEKFLEAKAKEENDYLLWIGKSRISLWKGDKSRNGIKHLQDRSVDFISEMIYNALLFLIDIEPSAI